jgi:CRP-like cAMP-binding protein
VCRGQIVTNPLILNLEQRDRLSPEERQALENAFVRTSTVCRGEDIVREGERPAESKVLLEGFAARYKGLRNGKRQITALHVTGDFVDLHSFVLKPMDHAVLALTPCRLALVPHQALRDLTEQYPHLARLFMLSIALDGAIHRQWLAMTGKAMALSQTAHLVCELYLRLHAVGKADNNSLNLPLTQPELGDVLGLSAVHVNRTIQDLRRHGLLTWDRNKVEILDWGRLCDVAEFDPTYLNLNPEPR